MDDISTAFDLLINALRSEIRRLDNRIDHIEKVKVDFDVQDVLTLFENHTHPFGGTTDTP